MKYFHCDIIYRIIEQKEGILKSLLQEMDVTMESLSRNK